MSVRSKIRQVPPAIKEYTGPYKTAGEYAEALRLWMMQVYQLQFVHCSFPLFLANLQSQNLSQNSSSGSQPTSANLNNSSVQLGATNQPPQATQNQGGQQVPLRGREYVIPPLWKRFVAEVIDFFLLFIIKLGVTYVVVDSFDLLEDLDKYDLQSLGADILQDYKLALSMTSDLLLLEMLHRIGTCLFESLCLQRGPDGLGGATPGKFVMKLRVIRCEHVAPTLTPGRVSVHPSTHLGFVRALTRSILKNLTMTFLFPISFALFSSQHNRMIYDVVSGSLVVEEVPRTNNL